MKKETKQMIRTMVNDCWKQFEEVDPDISTERLMQMVADHVNMSLRINLQASDVLDYLDED